MKPLQHRRHLQIYQKDLLLKIQQQPASLRFAWKNKLFLKMNDSKSSTHTHTHTHGTTCVPTSHCFTRGWLVALGWVAMVLLQSLTDHYSSNVSCRCRWFSKLTWPHTNSFVTQVCGEQLWSAENCRVCGKLKKQECQGNYSETLKSGQNE